MRKLIRKLAGYFGYDFVKVPATPLLKKDKQLQVGKFNLVVPSINPLIYTYSTQKDFASEIARIASCIRKKYPAMQVVDVGANIGDTMAILKGVDDIPVISIEGDAFSFSYLEKNSRQFKNVHLVNQYLGEKAGELQVNLDKAGWNTTLVPDSRATNKVDLKTLDEVLASQFPGFTNIKLLKIDTEGFDTIILRGADNLLRTARPLIYLEYNRDNMQAIKEDGLSTILQLRQKGYNRILFFDDRGRYILTTDLANTELISQLHRYADGKNGLIYYYNLCIVPQGDEDIAAEIEKIS